jgi:hypothetical protein
VRLQPFLPATEHNLKHQTQRTRGSSYFWKLLSVGSCYTHWPAGQFPWHPMRQPSSSHHWELPREFRGTAPSRKMHPVSPTWDFSPWTVSFSKWLPMISASRPLQWTSLAFTKPQLHLVWTWVWRWMTSFIICSFLMYSASDWQWPLSTSALLKSWDSVDNLSYSIPCQS